MKKTLIAVAVAALFAAGVTRCTYQQEPTLAIKTDNMLHEQKPVAVLVKPKTKLHKKHIRLVPIVVTPLTIKPAEEITTPQKPMALVEQAWHIEGLGLNPQDAIITIIDGKYCISIECAIALGLDLSKLTTLNGKVLLESIGKLNIDDSNAEIKIDTKTSLLPTTSIDMAARGIFMDPAAEEGSFFNYDLHSTAQAGTVPILSGLFEANTFVKGIRFNLQELVQNQGATNERIAASISKEDRATVTTWTIGDAASVAGTNVAPVNFTGVQYKKDYSLTPGFITSPMYNFSGTATAPSTLQVLMGNQVVRNQSIPPGPFEISNAVPSIGAGTATVIVKDIFGVQQVISVPVVGNPTALAKGVNDFSVQAGEVRTSLQNTEAPFVSGFYKQGLTDKFTVEGNGETSQASTLLSSVTHIGATGILTTIIGNFSGGGRIGTGNETQVGYQNGWNATDWHVSVNGSQVRTSSDYQQLGGGLVSPLTNMLQLTVQHLKVSLNALYSTSNGTTMTTIGGTLSPSKAGGISYSINAINTAGQTTGQTLMLLASIPFDNYGNRNHSANAGITSIAGQSTETFDYSNRPIVNIGATVSTHTASSASLKQQDLELDYRSYSYDAMARTSTVNGTTGEMAGIRGAVVLNNEYVGTTRHIDAGLGYAIVDTGAPNSVVKINENPNGQADANGVAVVSGFPAFIKNRVRLDPDSIPDDYDDAELPVASYSRAGTYLKMRPVSTSGTMVQVANHESGVIVVNGNEYPITDRGAYIELPPGDYVGTAGEDKIKFTIKENSK